MKLINVIILSIAIGLIIFGFATHTHPYDYMACGVGGLLFGAGLSDID